jgi:FtsZ-binding cell division protein ZapB
MTIEQTDAPELQRFSPYAVDGGCDAYGQMEEDEFGDYYNREDADATIQVAQAEIAKLRETNRSLNRRTQQAESVAYNNAGRWKRKLERVKAFADHMLTTNMRVNKREREAKAEVAALRKRVQAADAMADSCETYFESACDMTFVLEKLKAYCDTDAKP